MSSYRNYSSKSTYFPRSFFTNSPQIFLYSILFRLFSSKDFSSIFFMYIFHGFFKSSFRVSHQKILSNYTCDFSDYIYKHFLKNIARGFQGIPQEILLDIVQGLSCRIVTNMRILRPFVQILLEYRHIFFLGRRCCCKY